ncbi:MAG: HepT-like ribonuclease domain-containing protein [Acidimicrobiales bacterium]|nr:HepT-like ribonuclease domain-containing protein [Acidimicrobiales bacterium]
MSRSDDERVADIVDAADQIAEVIARGKAAWDDDRIGQLAVERLLEIIGESARAMSDAARSDHPDVSWSDVIGLRVVLAHHYHRVDPDQVWVIASTEVPKLVDQLA